MIFFWSVIIIITQILSAEETQKYREVDAIFDKMYNHSRVLALDKEAENLARILLEKYPHDPYIYNLWASTEWLLIGRELNLKANEQREIGEIDGYRERGRRYRQIVDKGLILTENSSDKKILFIRAALMFDHAKFSARYESRLSGLRRADKEAAEGIRILKKVIQIDPNFCSAYFLMGGNRLQLSTKTNVVEKLFAWKFSKVYNELYSLDSDVFNEKKSIEWLEKAYQCGFPQLWLKKTWLETSFLLMGAYRDYGKELDIKDEMAILQKEIPLLKRLCTIFPQNRDIVQILTEREFRLKILQSYFSKK